MDKVKVPSNVINKQLYRKVKLEADKVYKRPTSAYKSMWISKEYQKRGGKYTGEKKSLTGRWRQEKWIQVIPYVKNNKIIVCGADNKKNKVCRPLVRVDKNTPITMKEILDKWGKKKVLELANKKVRDMNGRVLWVNGRFIPSK